MGLRELLGFKAAAAPEPTVAERALARAADALLELSVLAKSADRRIERERLDREAAETREAIQAQESAALAAGHTEPPFRDDACPDCGCSHFTPGGPVVRPGGNGTSSRSVVDGAVLSCLGCGGRWYSTPSGLKRPHESALPPAWAMADMHQKSRQASEDRSGSKNGGRDESKPKRRVPGPHEGFMLPPKVS